MALPTTVIVKAPSSETMAAGSIFIPFGIAQTPVDDVYTYIPGTTLSANANATITVSLLHGTLTGGPAGSTGNGSSSITFTQSVAYPGVIPASVFNGLRITEPGAGSDTLTITVNDGVDPPTVRHDAITIEPVPTLVLPPTLTVATDEVTRLSGLNVIDPGPTRITLTVSAGELIAPGLGIDVTPGHSYTSDGTVAAATILSSLLFSDSAAGTATVGVTVTDTALGTSSSGTVSIAVGGFAATTASPLAYTGSATLGTTTAIGGFNGAGDALSVDGGGSLDLIGGVGVSSPYALTVGRSGRGSLETMAVGMAGTLAPQLAFGTLGVGVGGGSAGLLDLGIGALGATSGVVGQGGTGQVFAEAGSALGFGFAGVPQSGAIPLPLTLPAAAYGVGNGVAPATPLVLGAQAGSVGVLDTYGMLAVIGGVAVGQAGQGLLILDGPAAITGTLAIGAGSVVDATQGLLPGAVSIAAGGYLIAEGNGEQLLIGNSYPQPTVINTTVSGAGTLAIAAGGALELGVGASVSPATTIQFLPGVGTAGLPVSQAPAFDNAGDAGGRLMIRAGAMIAGVIAGFGLGDVIQFPDAVVTGTSTSADAVAGVVDLKVTLSAITNGATSSITLRLLNPAASGYALVTENIPYVNNQQYKDGITAVLAPAGSAAPPSADFAAPASLRVVAGSSTVIPGLASTDTHPTATANNGTITIAVQSGTLRDASGSATGSPGSPLVLFQTASLPPDADLANIRYTPGAGSSDVITVTDVSSDGTYTATIPVTISPAAQSFVWTGGVGGDFMNPAAWTGGAAGQAPVAGDTATFGPGLALVLTSGIAAAVVVTGTVEFEQSLQLTGSGTELTVNGGTAVFSPNSRLLAAGTLTVNSGVLQVDTVGATAGIVSVGTGAGSGGLLRVGTEALLNVGPVTLGTVAGADGRAEIDGQLVVSGDLDVGAAGSGEAVFAGPYNIITGGITLGDQAGSSGTLTNANSGLLIHKGITVGNLGAGTLIDSNGALNIAGALSVAAGAGSSGTFTLDGGTLQMSTANSFNGIADTSLYVGGSANGAGGTGTVILGTNDGAGGYLVAPTAATVYGKGTIALGGGSLLTPALTVASGGSVTGNGTVIAGFVVTLALSASQAPITAIANSGSITAQGGTLLLYANISGAGGLAIASGATLEIEGTATGGTLAFQPGAGTLVLDQADGFTDTITGFARGDTIDLPDVTAVGGTVAVSGNTVTVTEGSFTHAYTIAGASQAGRFVLTPDAGGGTAITLMPRVADDFNNDGKSDLLEQNSNGTGVIELDNGLAVTAAVSIGDPGPTWHDVAIADFNGDGQPDILLQNDNGSLVDYIMNGTSISAGYNLGNPGPSWHFRGAGDFNGDGNADVLLQNDNGALVILETNGSGLVGSALVGTLPAGAAVEAVADFNGDGMPDILVQEANGTLIDFTMQGTGIAAGNVIGVPGAGYSVAGTGDYNGDGRADILLHNDNGVDIIWEMNGPVVTAGVFAGNPGPAYTTAVTGVDLDGDGHADFVLDNPTTSTQVAFTLNNAAQITAGAVLGSPGPGWTLVGGNPISFLDGTGANLTVSGTPGPDQVVLTSYAAGIHTIGSFDPAQDTVALSLAAFPNYAAVQANEAPYQGGTFINLSPTAAIVIQGVTPGQPGAGNFVLR